MFAFFSVLCILNHVYHLPAMFGISLELISLELMDNLFLTGPVLGVLPSLFCNCRCFFLALPRKRALFLTVSNIFVAFVWQAVTKAAFEVLFGLPKEQPIA